MKTLEQIFQDDAQKWLTDDEMATWKELCAYQVENHPDAEMRDMFRRLLQLGALRLYVAQAFAPFAISPQI